jgi:hypothetical protein
LVESAYQILYDVTGDEPHTVSENVLEESKGSSWYDKLVNEWGLSPAEQMKEAQEEKKADLMAVRRKCLRFKEIGQPEKVKPCVEKETAKVNAHFAKVFASIKK